MCVISMISDVYRRQWEDKLPKEIFDLNEKNFDDVAKYVSKVDFDALKKEVEMLKQLLVEAKKYDERTNQPDCEQSEKVEIIRKVAELVGVDLKDVLK